MYIYCSKGYLSRYTDSFHIRIEIPLPQKAFRQLLYLSPITTVICRFFHHLSSIVSIWWVFFNFFLDYLHWFGFFCSEKTFEEGMDSRPFTAWRIPVGQSFGPALGDAWTRAAVHPHATATARRCSTPYTGHPHHWPRRHPKTSPPPASRPGHGSRHAWSLPRSSHHHSPSPSAICPSCLFWRKFCSFSAAPARTCHWTPDRESRHWHPRHRAVLWASRGWKKRCWTFGDCPWTTVWCSRDCWPARTDGDSGAPPALSRRVRDAMGRRVPPCFPVKQNQRARWV